MKKNYNTSSPNYLRISYIKNYKLNNPINYIIINKIDKNIFKYNLSLSKNISNKTAKVSPVTIHHKLIKKLKNKPKSNPNSISKSKSKSKEKGSKNLGKNNYGKSGKFIKNENKMKNINYIFSSGAINKKIIKNRLNIIKNNKLNPKIDVNINKSSKKKKKQKVLQKISKTKTNIFGFGYKNYDVNMILNKINQNNFKTSTSSGLNSTKSSKEKDSKKLLNITNNNNKNSFNKYKKNKKIVGYNKNNKLTNNLLISRQIKSKPKQSKINNINKGKNIIITNETDNKYNKSLIISKNPLIQKLNKKLYKTKTDNKNNINIMIKNNYEGINNNISNNINLFFLKKLSKANTKFINDINIYTKSKSKNKNKNSTSVIYYSKFNNNYSYSTNSNNSKHNSKSNSYKKKKLNNYKFTINKRLKKKGITANNTKLVNKLVKKTKNIKSKEKNINKNTKRKNILSNSNTNNKSALLAKRDGLINDVQKDLINNTKINNYNNKKNIENYINNSRKNSLSTSFRNENNININYLEESKKLSKKIIIYGETHEYKSYPKTNLHFYKIGRILGIGAFGKVNLALHILSGYLVAMKSFNKNKKNFPIQKIKNEIKIMQKLRNHKGIVKLLEAFENEKYYFIIMENVIGGSLLNAINKMGKFPESLAKKIFKQLIETVKYIHSKGIVHRDIKPDNILLNLNNNIKICDFGVSKEIKNGVLLSDSCGTPAFIAPEILLDVPYDPYMTDIWSCGVVLYVMISGYFPFTGINETQLNKNILGGKFFKISNISNDLDDLINKILELNPKKRIKLDEILNHPWLAKEEDINIKDLLYKKELFTEAEKIIYSKLRKNYKEINSNEEINLEAFTYRNIDTKYQDENLNDQTISIINTPFNSIREGDYDDDLYYNDVNIEIDIMKFLPKVNELNKLYELNNNCDYDQGYMLNRKENYNNKIMNSFNESYVKKQNEIKNKKEENINKKEKKLNKDMDNKEKSNENKINEDKNNIKPEKINLDENIIKYVENLGYKKEYIIKSLMLNELNYATATYYLKLSLNDE